MDQPVKLIPLLCTKCQAPVKAVQDESAWVCGSCGQAVYLDDIEGLKSVEIHYSALLKPETPGRPFWVADGTVRLNRQTYGSDRNREANNYWSTPRRFFIPAYACSMDILLQTGIQLLAVPPALQDGPAAPFQPVMLSPKDAHPAAEFIIVAVEAGRKDQMKEIQFTLEMTDPVLWILP